jgi:periplasmic divalent cation tolerance protein
MQTSAHPNTNALLVLTHLPDETSAHALAKQLIDARLAACVNILAPCLSVYRWQEKVEEARETPLLIKTTAAHYAALEAAIHNAHPYELPEIIAVPIGTGLDAYLGWIADATTPVPPSC